MLNFDDVGVIARVSAQLPLENLNIVRVWECQLRYRLSLSTLFKARAQKKRSENIALQVQPKSPTEGGLDPSKFVT